MIEAPFTAQAAAGLDHAPYSDDEGKDLPVRTVQFFNVGESGEKQARQECAEREDDAAREGFLADSQDGEAGTHNNYNFTARGVLRI